MLRKRLSVLIMILVLGLTVALVGCSSEDREELNSTLEATGYQGTLEDGCSIIFFEMSDETTIISLTDEEHQGDDALAYSGMPVKGDDGKVTVTDDESGESITYTLTENEDGTASIDVDGHGKSDLTVYEGNIFSIIGSMADEE